jgi:hypothetical protein
MTLGDILGARPPIRRRVFFSFHYDDIMRVNNVRNAWKIDHPDSPQMRSFYDSSLWESRQTEGPEALKRLIREGVEYTSCVCVLIGTETWSRRWVRYEIARAIIDGRGLLGVHINGVPHHQTRMPSPLGFNPLSYMAVGKVQSGPLSIPEYYLYVWDGSNWIPYSDHVAPVPRPRWLPDPAPNRVTRLDLGAATFDYAAQSGSALIGAWINGAAQLAGR